MQIRQCELCKASGDDLLLLWHFHDAEGDVDTVMCMECRSFLDALYLSHGATELTGDSIIYDFAGMTDA